MRTEADAHGSFPFCGRGWGGAELLASSEATEIVSALSEAADSGASASTLPPEGLLHGKERARWPLSTWEVEGQPAALKRSATRKPYRDLHSQRLGGVPSAVHHRACGGGWFSKGGRFVLVTAMHTDFYAAYTLQWSALSPGARALQLGVIATRAPLPSRVLEVRCSAQLLPLFLFSLALAAICKQAELAAGGGAPQLGLPGWAHSLASQSHSHVPFWLKPNACCSSTALRRTARGGGGPGGRVHRPADGGCGEAPGDRGAPVFARMGGRSAQAKRAGCAAGCCHVTCPTKCRVQRRNAVRASSCSTTAPPPLHGGDDMRARQLPTQSTPYTAACVILPPLGLAWELALAIRRLACPR